MSFVKFKKDWDKAVVEIKTGTEKAIKAASFQLFSEIIQRTPVDTGRLAGNWQASTGSPKSGVIAEKGRGAAIASARGAVSNYSIKNNESIFLTNNLEYAQIIEDGTAGRRPYGMVKTSINDFSSSLKKLSKKYTK